jgi:hypothetical protein
LPAERGRGQALPALVLGVFGIVIALLGYAIGQTSLNVDELVGPAAFWSAVVALLLVAPFRDAASAFSRAIRTPFGSAVFIAYVAVHLFPYGFLLDAILASIYGTAQLATGGGLFLTTNLFSPLSLTSLFFDISYNPVVIVAAPPIFSEALSFYSVAVAVVIGILVVANVGRTRELGALRTAKNKARIYVVLPAVGIVLGASCCLSVAGLIGLASPAASVLSSSAWVYYVTYFLLPCVAMAILYLNLRSIVRISAGLSSR